MSQPSIQAMLSVELDDVFSMAMEPPFFASHPNLENYNFIEAEKVSALEEQSIVSTSILPSKIYIKLARQRLKFMRYHQKSLKLDKNIITAKMSEVHDLARLIHCQNQELSGTSETQAGVDVQITDKRIVALHKQHQHLQQLRDKLIPTRLKESAVVINIIKETIRRLEERAEEEKAREKRPQVYPPEFFEELVASMAEGAAPALEGRAKARKARIERLSDLPIGLPPEKFFEELAAAMAVGSDERYGADNDGGASSDTETVRGGHSSDKETVRNGSPPSRPRTVRAAPSASSSKLGLGTGPQSGFWQPPPRHDWSAPPLKHHRSTSSSYSSPTSDVDVLSKGKNKLYTALFGPAVWKEDRHRATIDMLKHHRKHDDVKCPVYHRIRDDPDDASYVLVDFTSRDEGVEFVSSWSRYRNHDLYHNIKAVGLNF